MDRAMSSVRMDESKLVPLVDKKLDLQQGVRTVDLKEPKSVERWVDSRDRSLLAVHWELTTRKLSSVFQPEFQTVEQLVDCSDDRSAYSSIVLLVEQTDVLMDVEKVGTWADSWVFRNVHTRDGKRAGMLDDGRVSLTVGNLAGKRVDSMASQLAVGLE
jgi:hypothetical protein